MLSSESGAIFDASLHSFIAFNASSINELFSVPQNVMLAHFDESAANAEVANVSEVILIANASNNDKIFFIIFTYFIQFLKR